MAALDDLWGRQASLVREQLSNAASWAERLTAFDIEPDGSLAGRRVWAETPGSPPDGIALDAERKFHRMKFRKAARNGH